MQYYLLLLKNGDRPIGHDGVRKGLSMPERPQRIHNSALDQFMGDDSPFVGPQNKGQGVSLERRCGEMTG